MQYHGKKTKHHPKSSPKNMQSNGHQPKSPVLCLVQWAINSGARGLLT